MEQTSEPVQALIPWNCEEGKRRLFASKYCNAFFTLAHLFERQIKPTYCGVASAVMVLNALRREKQGLKLEDRLDLRLPEPGAKQRFNYYSQLTLLDRKAAAVKEKRRVEGFFAHASVQCGAVNFDPGFALADLARLLKLQMLRVELCSAEHACGLARFRDDLRAYTNDRDTFLIANFDSSTLGREGGGHFSPLAGYHPESDSCLVMDVNGCRQPWFWAPVEHFHTAMRTRDGDAWRGYLIVSDRL